MNVETPIKPARSSDAADTDGISRRLCEAVAEWRFEDIPADVVARTKLLAVDTFGVIGGAARAPGIAEINGRLTRWESNGSATVLIGGHRLSPPAAAMANGAAAHALDFDDMHDPARIHGFTVLLPTMLATAEDLGGVDGRRFLLALATAAEVHARLGFTCFNSLGKGWHPTMTLGVLAGAVGAGKLIGLDTAGLLNALGIAFHQACGTAQSMHDGVLTKRLGPGFAARAAVTAAFLAADGVTGPYRPLEGAAGLFNLYERGEVRPEELLGDIGEGWRTLGFSFKPYPCCRCNHTTIDLALALRAEGLRREDVVSARIELPQVNFQTVGQPYQASRDSVVHAQFNVSYAFARALTDGKVDLGTYTRPGITDAAVARLAERVTAAPDPTQPPTAMGPSRITVQRTDGRAIEARADDIHVMSEDEVLAKFRSCLGFGLELPEAEARRFEERLLALETLDDVSVLAREFPHAR